MSTYSARLHHQIMGGNTQSISDNEFGTVMVLYTGGTIGMKLNNDGVYVNDKDLLHKWLKEMPMCHDKDYAAQRQLIDPPFLHEFRGCPLYMPVIGTKEVKHITYILYEYQQLVDSSNLDSDIMLQIAMDVKRFYKKFDAFVILHGTDTMCYTAAALSFILEDLGKPVILTGSQIPIFETRSDGQENLQGALILAGSFNIPEVCLFFNNNLFRGNRARKVSADTLDAFDSPNFPPLGKLEVNVTVYWDLVQRPATTRQFNVHTILSHNVAVFRVFPNLSADVARAFLQDPIEGIVMQCYGAGNFPDHNPELLSVLQEACDRGVIIVNTTQCRRGSVSISYAGAKSLLDVGVVAGYDMTSEAALAKLSYVLTKNWSLEEKKQYMSRNVRGELTTSEILPKDHILSDGLSALGLELDMVGKTVKNMAELRNATILPLMCLSIKHGDLDALDKVCQKYPGNILTKDHDGRTPLHLAVREGSYAIVKYLIKQGASIHSKDQLGRQPLMEAVLAKRLDVIELLRKSGAHLSMHPQKLAMELNQAASQGDLQLITAFWRAGANFNVWDYSHRTPLHMAVLNWGIHCVGYILDHGGNPFLCDDTGRTVLQLTMNTQIISLVNAAVEAKRWTKSKNGSAIFENEDKSEATEEDQIVVAEEPNGEVTPEERTLLEEQIIPDQRTETTDYISNLSTNTSNGH